MCCDKKAEISAAVKYQISAKYIGQQLEIVGRHKKLPFGKHALLVFDLISRSTMSNCECMLFGKLACFSAAKLSGTVYILVLNI
jgi:hypothetical protein